VCERVRGGIEGLGGIGGIWEVRVGILRIHEAFSRAEKESLILFQR
jgi:hypothetical protein